MSICPTVYPPQALGHLLDSLASQCSGIGFELSYTLSYGSGQLAQLNIECRRCEARLRYVEHMWMGEGSGGLRRRGLEAENAEC
jgi:hypothetical protein